MLDSWLICLTLTTTIGFATAFTTTAKPVITTCTVADVFDVGVASSLTLKHCQSEHNYMAGKGYWNDTVKEGNVCRLSCRKLMDVSMNNMAERNCDLPVGVMESGMTKLVSKYADSDALNISDMVRKMRKKNVTEITHEDFQTGRDHLRQICATRTLANGSTTDCAHQYAAINDAENKNHVYFCGSFSRTCSELKATINAYARKQPSFDSISKDYNIDEDDECETLVVYDDIGATKNSSGTQPLSEPTTTSSSFSDIDNNIGHAGSGSSFGAGYIALLVLVALGVVAGMAYGTLRYLRQPQRYKPVEMYTFDDNNDDDGDGNDDDLLGATLKMGDVMEAVNATELATDDSNS